MVFAFSDVELEAKNDRQRERYAADPTVQRAASKRWYDSNRDRVLAYTSEYSKRKRAERTDDEREAFNAYLREWKSLNPDKVRQHQLTQAEKDRLDPSARREYVRRRRARLKAATIVPFTLAQLEQRMSMFPGCWMCGGPKEEVDHMKPLAKGGAHCLANAYAACRSCNGSKADKWYGAAETIRRLRRIRAIPAA